MLWMVMAAQNLSASSKTNRGGRRDASGFQIMWLEQELGGKMQLSDAFY